MMTFAFGVAAVSMLACAGYSGSELDKDNRDKGDISGDDDSSSGSGNNGGSGKNGGNNGANPGSGNGTGGGGGNGTGGGGGNGGGGGGGTGGGGGGGGGGAAKGFDVALDKTSSDTELLQKSSYTVTLTGKEGFAGNATLSATGLPAGAKATFTPSSIAIGAGPVTVKLDIDGANTTGASMVKVIAASGTVTPEATLALNVKPRLTINIPNNAPSAPNVFGSREIVVHHPTIGAGANALVVTFVNKDTSKDHIIHSSNTRNGFAHGDVGRPIGLNETTVRNVSGTGDYPVYLHDDNKTDPSTTIRIQP
ncbi:hypothetical protein [Pendulispora albinea]|uniref:Uncharacterized protein n=1 Tax=Pendulispora albinea TaxID=2741071 RepID=A0ABZ2M5F1_9BACT